MRISFERPVPGARVFCNGVEFGHRLNGYDVLVADEEQGVVEAVHYDTLRCHHHEHPTIDPFVRYFTGTVKIIVPPNGGLVRWLADRGQR